MSARLIVRVSLNRTILELKLEPDGVDAEGKPTLNRTILELKPCILPIVSTARPALNRTILELKPRLARLAIITSALSIALFWN